MDPQLTLREKIEIVIEAAVPIAIIGAGICLYIVTMSVYFHCSTHPC